MAAQGELAQAYLLLSVLISGISSERLPVLQNFWRKSNPQVKVNAERHYLVKGNLFWP